uniref:Polyprotein n=1 Tax=Paris mosaic virus 1 TaxID=3064729 RepID=A0AA49K3P2_9SECO|nr:polyprotein [Paris mosaic virus 1]
MFSLIQVCSFAGVALPSYVMAEMPSKFPFSKFILESGRVVEVRALTATRLTDAYKALCVIQAERRAYKALPAVEKKRLWRARCDRRAKALSKKKAAAAKAAELAAVHLAAKKRAQAKAILKSLEKEPSKAQVACARRYWKKVEASLPPRPTEAQCLLAKYRAWRNKMAAKAAMARFLASLPSPPPKDSAYSKADYPMGVLSSPPSSPLNSSFGKVETPSSEGVFPLPLVVRGWRILPALQRVSLIAQALDEFVVKKVGGNAFSCLRKAFRITKGLVQACQLQAKYLFGNIIDVFTASWCDYVSPVQRTGSLKGCYTCLPVLRENCNGILYPKRISYSIDKEGCDCNDCTSTFWLDMVSPVQSAGSLKGVFNGFPVYKSLHRNDLKRSVVIDRSSDEEGCTCDECILSFWMEMVTPVQRTGSLKGVFNDFPVHRAEYCDEIYISMPIDRSSDVEGCSCEECTPTWLDYISPVQRTGRLHSDYIGVPTLRATLLKKNGKWDYYLPHGRYIVSIPKPKFEIEGECTCAVCECTRRGETYDEQGCVHHLCKFYCEACRRRKGWNDANAREVARQRAYLGLGKYILPAVSNTFSSDTGNGRGYVGLCKTTPFVFRGDFSNKETEEICNESSECYSSNSELHEEAQLASEQIERNYNLLTPQNLIETALSKEQRGFKVGEGKILGKTHLHEKDVFYIESFLEKMKRKGLGKGLEADSVTTLTTGQKDDAPSFKRSYSISGPASLAGRQTVFSQRFVPPVVKQREEQTPSRYSVSDTYSGIVEESVNNTSSTISGIFSFEEFKVPLGTTAGKVLCDHQLMASGRLFAGKVWHQLLEMQNFVGDFNFEVSLTTTPLLGISIGVCFDFYNSINLTVLKDLPISAGALLPNFVFSPGEKIKGNVNIADCLGHSLSARANSFGSGRIIVYTITNSSITAASDFTGVLYVHLTNVKPSSLLLRPLVSLPEFTTDVRHSDIGIGKFFKKEQGATSAFSKFNIDFATLVTVLSNKSVLHPAAALQNIMSGQEGDLVLEFQKLSSAFIQASFVVSAWWGTDDHTLDEILRVQHTRLDTGSGRVVIPLATKVFGISDNAEG